MTSGLLQDTLPSPTTDAGSASGPRFRPYASPNHHVTKSRYITSNDPRGYIPVYEYPLNGQWIMMDVDDGYVLWTGIWKALGNSKADIVKMIESQPDLASQIRRVRGGYLKIQGTWMPYEVALRLSRRVAWPIRHDLVPLFGPTFPSTCLMPDQPGYGQVVNNGNGRRRARRSNAQNPSLIGGESSSAPQAGWTIISSVPPQDASGQSGPPVSLIVPSSFPPTAWASQQMPITGYRQSVDPSMASFSASPTDGGADRLSVVREQSQRSRFSPYPGPPSSASYAPSFVSGKSSPISMHYMPPEPPASSEAERRQAHGERVTLPPIQLPSENRVAGRSQFSLPPISTLAGAASTSPNDSRDVLKRLQADDSSDEFRPPSEGRWHRRRSPSASPDGQVSDISPSWYPTHAHVKSINRSQEHFETGDLPHISLPPFPLQREFSSSLSSPAASLLSSATGASPTDPSPTSPKTPQSARSYPDGASSHSLTLPPIANLKVHSQTTSELMQPPGLLHGPHDIDRLAPYGRYNESDQGTMAARSEAACRQMAAHDARNRRDPSERSNSRPIRPW